MKKQVKTLEQSANELEASVNRLHEVRIDFIRVYVDTLRTERYSGDNYFQDKFGERLDGGYGYSR